VLVSPAQLISVASALPIERGVLEAFLGGAP